MKPAGTLAAAIALTSLAGAYLRFGRRWVLNWGARPGEVTAALPGDTLLPSPDLQTTRGITIDATTDRVWPWLVQIGPRPRAGIYTYDWIERLFGIDIENSDRILPGFQHLEPGEFFTLSSKGNGLRVREVLSGHALVLQWEPGSATWALILEPQTNGTTRLISRNRIAGSGPLFRLGMLLMEPLSLVMERKMLLGFKERAERGDGSAPPPASSA